MPYHKNYQVRSVFSLVFFLWIAGMLCIPHSRWNNSLAVGSAFGSAVIAGLSIRNDSIAKGRMGPILWGVLVFLTMDLLSCLWAVFPLAAARVTVFHCSAALLGSVTYALTAREDDVHSLLTAIYAALVLSALYGLLLYFSHRDAYAVAIGRELRPRLGSTLEHGINYGEFVAMAFPLAAIRADQAADRRARGILRLLLLFPLGALALTYSRTGYLALSAAVIVWKRLWKKPGVLLLIAVAAIMLLPGNVLARAMTMLTVTDESASGRFTLWRECFAALREHWLFGIGGGSENFFRAYLPHASGTLPFQPPHTNMGYMEIFLSLGVIGEIAFLVFFLGIFPRIRSALSRQPVSAHANLLRAAEGSLAGAAAANIPEHIWFYPRVLFFWSVVYALAFRLSEKEAA